MMQAFPAAVLFLIIFPLIQGFTELSSPDGVCAADTVCTPLDSCPYWKEKHEEFSQLRKLKKDTSEVLVEIRSAVCNKKEKV